MNVKRGFILVLVFILGLGVAWARANGPPQFPKNPTFSTLITMSFVIEGLTGDQFGNLYTAGVGNPCPVWRINLANPSLVVVGNLSAPCFPLGIALNDLGDLFVANAADGTIYTFTPNSAAPPTAVAFATGFPGSNGIAFDRNGNLFVSDGTTGQGRVWKITPGAVVTEAFRIPPMRNSTALGGMVGGSGVGREINNVSQLTSQPQDIVANGLAFTKEGDLLVTDTARGAIWKVEFDRRGNLKSETGCDPTLTANTLCLSNVFVAHPVLEGADGIALDRAGNMWVDANERNAVGVVTKDGRVAEVFRNDPDPMTNLRNTGPLEFPSSPFISGKIFCTANFDRDRRDNDPNTAGEIGGGGQPLGKISCMDQEVKIQGLPLPIQ